MGFTFDVKVKVRAVKGWLGLFTLHFTRMKGFVLGATMNGIMERGLDYEMCNA